jgi:hypothetical protein
LFALTGTVSYARCNNNCDQSPLRRHGFLPKVATTPAYSREVLDVKHH